MGRLIAALILALLALQPAALAQGVEGRASVDGVLGKEITVRAYPIKGASFGPFTGEKFTASAAVKPDGHFSLPLPPGKYVLDAIHKKPGNSGAGPQTGDHYCVYSGSPVTVAPGKWSAAGFYLMEVAPELRTKGDQASIKGKLTHKGKPVERTYLYLYSSTGDGFRGPADMLQPVESGSFEVRVPPGRYWLVARKRLQGGSYGPVNTGDLFNFYPLNPVTVGAGEKVELSIPLIEKLSQVDETGVYKGIKITVADLNGRPLEKQFILAYTGEQRTGHPVATAGPTGKDGTAFLMAGPEAKFLRVRRQIGGPPEEGEKYTDATLPAGAAEMKIVFTGKGISK